MTQEDVPAWARRLKYERWDRRRWSKARMARELIAAEGRHALVSSLVRQIGVWESGKQPPPRMG